MSRRNYEMLSKVNYLDLQTGKIITASERRPPYTTKIPNYFWSDDIKEKVSIGFEMKNGNLVDTYSINSKVNQFELRGIRVTLHDNLNTTITFYDNRKKTRHEIYIKENCMFSQMSLRGGKTGKLLMGVDYVMTFDSQQSATFRTMFSDREAIKPIGYLAQHTLEEMPKNNTLTFSYGLTCKPYNIVYNNRKLEGNCYAFIYGSWAILLQDNLSFDALVLLKGCNSETLTVDRFIYTTNVYLTKIVVLTKG